MIESDNEDFAAFGNVDEQIRLRIQINICRHMVGYKFNYVSHIMVS